MACGLVAFESSTYLTPSLVATSSVRCGRLPNRLATEAIASGATPNLAAPQCRCHHILKVVGPIHADIGRVLVRTFAGVSVEGRHDAPVHPRHQSRRSPQPSFSRAQTSSGESSPNPAISAFEPEAIAMHPGSSTRITSRSSAFWFSVIRPWPRGSPRSRSASRSGRRRRSGRSPPPGWNLSMNASWKLESSATRKLPATESLAAVTNGTPMLPTASAPAGRPPGGSRPAEVVVVVLPLVPVIASTGPLARPNPSSTSLITLVPRASAAARTGLAGGTPGLGTIRSAQPRSSSTTVLVRLPEADPDAPLGQPGAQRLAGRVGKDSWARTSAPEERSTSATAAPVILPRPRIRTRCAGLFNPLRRR